MRNNNSCRPNWVYEIDDSAIGINLVTIWDAIDKVRRSPRRDIRKKNECPADGEQHMSQVASQHAIDEASHEGLDKTNVYEVPRKERKSTERQS